MELLAEMGELSFYALELVVKLVELLLGLALRGGFC